MLFRLLADFTVVLHFAFVVFVGGGGLLALRWPRVAWAHLPAAVWGAWIEFAGWICPLTPLENWLRRQGGAPTYASTFIEQYVLPILYPAALSRELQYGLGAFVVVINAAIYGILLFRRKRLTS